MRSIRCILLLLLQLTHSFLLHMRSAGLVLQSKDIPTLKGQPFVSLGSPRVLPPGKEGEEWLIWFHGRDAAMSKGDDSSILIKQPTGRILLAASKDGIKNFKFDADSPVLNPSKEAGDWFYFDSEHVGIGDIILPGMKVQSKFNTQEGVFLMYIFGGNSDSIQIDDKKVKGMKMEIGLAVSQDGSHWSRVEGPSPYGSIIETGKDINDFDNMYVGWPTVLEVDRQFFLYYHTYNSKISKYMVGLATASDGIKWKKIGPILGGGGSSNPDSFDSKGVTCRHVSRIKQDGTFRMWYEGINKNGNSAIGIATSFDGIKWEKLSEDPVFKPNTIDQDAWDCASVGQPNLVWLDDKKKWRMYYVGSDFEGQEGIGVAESDDEYGLSFTRL